MIHNQWITVYGGVIGIDLSTAIDVSKTMDIEVTESLLKKLKLLESLAMDDINKKGADANGG
jgi:hypothetical protein